nr:hypothetical protein [Bdellovibrionales bacterium]
MKSVLGLMILAFSMNGPLAFGQDDEDGTNHSAVYERLEGQNRINLEIAKEFCHKNVWAACSKAIDLTLGDTDEIPFPTTERLDQVAVLINKACTFNRENCSILMNRIDIFQTIKERTDDQVTNLTEQQTTIEALGAHASAEDKQEIIKVKQSIEKNKAKSAGAQKQFEILMTKVCTLHVTQDYCSNYLTSGASPEFHEASALNLARACAKTDKNYDPQECLILASIAPTIVNSKEIEPVLAEACINTANNRYCKLLPLLSSVRQDPSRIENDFMNACGSSKSANICTALLGLKSVTGNPDKHEKAKNRACAAGITEHCGIIMRGFLYALDAASYVVGGIMLI